MAGTRSLFYQMKGFSVNKLSQSCRPRDRVSNLNVMGLPLIDLGVIVDDIIGKIRVEVYKWRT